MQIKKRNAQTGTCVPCTSQSLRCVDFARVLFFSLLTYSSCWRDAPLRASYRVIRMDLSYATWHRKAKEDALIPIPAYFQYFLLDGIRLECRIARVFHPFLDDSRKYKSLSFLNKYFLKTGLSLAAAFQYAHRFPKYLVGGPLLGWIGGDGTTNFKFKLYTP